MTLDRSDLTPRLIAHRGVWDGQTPANSPAALRAARERGYGIETDLRDALGTLVISHDPPSLPLLEASENLLAHASQVLPGMLALNVKADGLTTMVGPLIEALAPERFFFFDMSWPQTLAYTRARLPVALRVSEWEPLDLTLFDRLGVPVRVWLDAFSSDWWADDPAILDLCQRGQVAIVSPELHGRPPEAAWDWFGGRVAEGDDLYLCTDRCDEVLEQLS